MDSRERVLDALSGNIPDVPPVAIFTQSATVGMMEACDVWWPNAHDEPAMMARLGSVQAESFGFESVRVPFDITAEASRLGCVVDPGSMDSPPSIRSHAIPFGPLDGVLPETDVLMTPDDFISSGRPKVVLDAIGLCSKNAGRTYPVCGGLLGPVSLLSQLMGAENMVMSTLLEPDWTDTWCSALSKTISVYAEVQRDMGADIITIVEAVASPDILDPASYQSLSGRHMPDIIPGEDSKTVLHICGNTEPILDEISRCGTDAFLPDPAMDPGLVIGRLNDRMQATGSVDPVGTLLFGRPDNVASSAHRYAESGFSVIASGCGLAPHTPNDNLHALSSVFRR